VTTYRPALLALILLAACALPPSGTRVATHIKQFNLTSLNYFEI
jgi:hypothetical protein